MKSLLFTAVLCGMLTAASAMAGDVSTDFHALRAMSSPVPVMTETQMASVQGGQLSDLLSLVGRAETVTFGGGLSRENFTAN